VKVAIIYIYHLGHTVYYVPIDLNPETVKIG